VSAGQYEHVQTAVAPDGATIAYDAVGAGPVLLLVHGITECRGVWDPLLERLSREHLVVAIDLRGHGDSERRPPYDAMTMAVDAQSVVAELAAPAAPLVVGHSLGGVVASFYAASASTRGVINIDQPLALAGFKELLTPIEPMLRGDRETFETLIRSLFETFYPPLPEAERRRVAALSHPEQDVVLGVWDAVLRSSTEELDALVASTTASIRTPYLSLHGTDPGAQYAQWLGTAIPNAQFEVWLDHGHYPHLLEPSRFSERLGTFEHAI
jgi:pimeloyl-ACP methyl ester carboxylesterase